jgi:hypothetical protein
MSLLFSSKANNDLLDPSTGRGLHPQRHFYKHVDAAFDERRIPARHTKSADDLTLGEEAYITLTGDGLHPYFSYHG